MSDLQCAACAVVPEHEIAEKEIPRNHVEGAAGLDRHTVVIAFHESVFHKQILAGAGLNAVVVLNPGNALVAPDGAVLHAADDEVPELRIVEERAVIKQILSFVKTDASFISGIADPFFAHACAFVFSGVARIA